MGMGSQSYMFPSKGPYVFWDNEDILFVGEVLWFLLVVGNDLGLVFLDPGVDDWIIRDDGLVTRKRFFCILMVFRHSRTRQCRFLLDMGMGWGWWGYMVVGTKVEIWRL